MVEHIYIYIYGAYIYIYIYRDVYIIGVGILMALLICHYTYPCAFSIVLSTRACLMSGSTTQLCDYCYCDYLRSSSDTTERTHTSPGI